MGMPEYAAIQARVGFGADSGVWQKDLPTRGYISSLILKVEWTNGATSCKDQDIYSILNQIEVIANGNTRLYSLTGEQARLWTHAYMGYRPPYYRSEVPDVVQTGFIIIPFSLGLMTPGMYLDCSRYNHLEVRVTFAPTIAATSFVTGTGYISVYANMYRAAPPGGNAGFVSLRERRYFTSVASGIEIVELPMQNALAGIGIYVYEAGIDPHANVDDVKVNCDNGSFVPVEGRFEDLLEHYTALLGIDPTEWGVAYKSNTDTIETLTGTCGSISLEKEQSLTIGTTDELVNVISALAGGQATLQTLARDAAATVSDAADTTDMPIKWIAKAKHGLGNFLILPFGFKGSPEDALMSGDFKRVELELDQGNSGAEIRVSTLELVR